jgi:hypothetical protein
MPRLRLGSLGNFCYGRFRVYNHTKITVVLERDKIMEEKNDNHVTVLGCVTKRGTRRRHQTRLSTQSRTS